MYRGSVVLLLLLAASVAVSAVRNLHSYGSLGRAHYTYYPVKGRVGRVACYYYGTHDSEVVCNKRHAPKIVGHGSAVEEDICPEGYFYVTHGEDGVVCNKRHALKQVPDVLVEETNEDPYEPEEETTKEVLVEETSEDPYEAEEETTEEPEKKTTKAIEVVETTEDPETTEVVETTEDPETTEELETTDEPEVTKEVTEEEEEDEEPEVTEKVTEEEEEEDEEPEVTEKVTEEEEEEEEKEPEVTGEVESVTPEEKEDGEVQSAGGCPDKQFFMNKVESKGCQECGENCGDGEGSCADDVGCTGCKPTYFSWREDADWPYSCKSCAAAIEGCLECGNPEKDENGNPKGVTEQDGDTVVCTKEA